MDKNLKKAVLFFSRTAEEEAKHKSFHSHLSYKGNMAIGKRLISSTLETFASTDIPLISCFSPDQVGDSFGWRLSNAVEDVFASGYDQVVVIGNDCPSINKEFILESFDSINRGQVVLGPANDGGVYLLGLDKTNFDKNHFASLEWMKSELQNSLRSYCQAQSSEITWLEEQQDIDSIADLEKVLELLPKFSLLRKQLAKIVSDFKQRIFEFVQQHIVTFLKTADFNSRGPPVVV